MPRYSPSIFTLVRLSALLFASPPITAESDPALPADVPASWWSQVQRSIELDGYTVEAAEADASVFRATNPAQRFKTTFDAEGLLLTPTTMRTSDRLWCGP